MKPTIAVALVLAAAASPGLAQDGGAAKPTCFIEVARLMAEPPAGIADLGAALRELDSRLRPQVEDVLELKAHIARLEQRGAGSAAGAGVDAASFEGEDEGRLQLLPNADAATTEELQQAQAKLDAKQAQLKLAYAAQQSELVTPVEERVSEGAQAYGTEQNCREVRMARAPDLAALTAAGARDLTRGFVAWYAASHSPAALSSR